MADDLTPERRDGESWCWFKVADVEAIERERDEARQMRDRAMAALRATQTEWAVVAACGSIEVIGSVARGQLRALSALLDTIDPQTATSAAQPKAGSLQRRSVEG